MFVIRHHGGVYKHSATQEPDGAYRVTGLERQPEHDFQSCPHVGLVWPAVECTVIGRLDDPNVEVL